MNDEIEAYSPVWVTKGIASEALGLTVRQIESRIQRGLWKRGEHFAVLDRRTMVNLPAVDELHSVIAYQQRKPYAERQVRLIRKAGRLE